MNNLLKLLIILSVCHCAQLSTKGQPLMEHGILIENGIYRGTGYTDSMGIDYNLRYAPISITNNKTMPIDLQLIFAPEYHPPHPCQQEQFKLIPLPKEWALDGVEIAESMVDALPNYIDQPTVTATILPGEKLVMAIGTLYARPTNFTGVLPIALFTSDQSKLYAHCQPFTSPMKSTATESTLGLQLKFGPDCTIIHCGKIYVDK